MSSKIANQEYHQCPECDKSFKHLIPHLKNKHAWQVEDIFDFNRKVQDSKATESELRDVASGEEMCTEDESRYAARKVSEVELEVKANARRAVDKTVMMHALAEMNTAIHDMYEKIEANVKNITMEAGKVYMRAGGDVIDGPRNDSTKRVRAILKPSSDYLRECVMHELCRISGELKNDITSIL